MLRELVIYYGVILIVLLGNKVNHIQASQLRVVSDNHDKTDTTDGKSLPKPVNNIVPFCNQNQICGQSNSWFSDRRQFFKYLCGRSIFMITAYSFLFTIMSAEFETQGGLFNWFTGFQLLCGTMTPCCWQECAKKCVMQNRIHWSKNTRNCYYFITPLPFLSLAMFWFGNFVDVAHSMSSWESILGLALVGGSVGFCKVGYDLGIQEVVQEEATVYVDKSYSENRENSESNDKSSPSNPSASKRNQAIDRERSELLYCQYISDFGSHFVSMLLFFGLTAGSGDDEKSVGYIDYLQNVIKTVGCCTMVLALVNWSLLWEKESTSDKSSEVGTRDNGKSSGDIEGSNSNSGNSALCKLNSRNDRICTTKKSCQKFTPIVVLNSTYYWIYMTVNNALFPVWSHLGITDSQNAVLQSCGDITVMTTLFCLWSSPSSHIVDDRGKASGNGLPLDVVGVSSDGNPKVPVFRSVGNPCVFMRKWIQKKTDAELLICGSTVILVSMLGWWMSILQGNDAVRDGITNDDGGSDSSKLCTCVCLEQLAVAMIFSVGTGIMPAPLEKPFLGETQRVDDSSDSSQNLDENSTSGNGGGVVEKYCCMPCVPCVPCMSWLCYCSRIDINGRCLNLCTMNGAGLVASMWMAVCGAGIWKSMQYGMTYCSSGCDFDELSKCKPLSNDQIMTEIFALDSLVAVFGLGLSVWWYYWGGNIGKEMGDSDGGDGGGSSVSKRNL